MKLKHYLQLIIWWIFKPYKVQHYYLRRKDGMHEFAAFKDTCKINKNNCLK